MTYARATLLSIATGLLGLCLGWLTSRSYTPTSSSREILAPANSPADIASTQNADTTLLYAHNLMLRKGPDFRVYVRWIRGQMVRTRKQVNPSFDDPDSFILEIEKGVIRANIGDVSNFLNANSPSDAPLHNITIQPDGDQLALRGTVHKIFSFPVELKGALAPTPDGRVQFHLTHLDVLKLPVKWLLGGFHLQLSDLVHTGNLPGMELTGNDIFFDTQKLLPPPHIHGRITSVRVSVPDIEVVYGGVSVDEAQLAQWHNFLRLSGGTLDFGKLTMHHADLTMIDASPDPWFDLDLVNYQAQLVDGYSRMTAQAGLEIFMPDGDGQAKKKPTQAITLEWLRNRNRSLPADIPR